MDNDFVPIKLLEVLVDQIGTPRNDRTAGSALYKVPIELSASPPREWSEYFVAAFDHPSEYTAMHRPGIASIRGPSVVLEGTTIEEVEKYHAKTLKLAVDCANRDYPALLAKRRHAAEVEQQRIENHRKEVAAAAKKIKFE